MFQPIQDFRGGLDTRKMSLALPAGTLIQCNNAHINQGAEIEKRKAFVQWDGQNIPNSSTYPTFGACGAPTLLYIFGSGSLAAGAVNSNTYPAPVAYQMLVHPAVAAGTAYAQGTHNMTAAVYSTLFGQYPFVIAQFADGGVYCYYNGVFVEDYASGVVLAYLAGSASGLATAIANLVNSTNNYTAETNGSSFGVFSLPGSSYSATVSIESLSCITVSTDVSTGYPTGTVTNDTSNNSPDGTKVTIGGQVYRFKNTMAAAFDVQIGQTSLATMQNLYKAIGATGTAGVNYYTGTTANAVVKASLFVQTPNPSFTLTAKTINTHGETYHPSAGISLTNETDTVSLSTGAQAVGQFQIVAGIASASVSAATGTLTGNSTALADGALVTVGYVTYRIKNTMAQAYDVQRNATSTVTLQNLVYAIGASGTPGTNYFAGTLANPLVYVSGFAGYIITVSAALGATGNTIPLTGATNLAASGALLSGGAGNTIAGITIGPLAAHATVVPSGANLLNGDTLAVGSTTYTFKTTLSTEGDIQIGISFGDTLQNLIDAVNLSGIYGVNYQVSTLNQQVISLATVQGGNLVLLARAAGSAGNSIGLTSSTAKLVAPANLTNGADNLQLITGMAVAWYPGQTYQQFTNAVANAISTAQGTTGFYAINKGGTIFIYSVGNNSYSTAANITVTASGQICIGQGGFQYTHQGNGAGSINTVVANNNTLLGTTQSLGTQTMAQLVTAVATAIIGNTASSNQSNGNGGYFAINAFYTAVQQGTILYLSKLVTSSSDYPIVETTTTDGTYITGAEVAANQLSVTIPATLGVPNTGTASATALATGGYPPYAYNWQIAAGSDPSLGLQILNNGTNTVNFSIDPTSPNPHNVVTCTVTDSLGNSVTSNIMVVGKT